MQASKVQTIVAEHGTKVALAMALAEKRKKLLRRRFAAPGGLVAFMEYFWDVLEPTQPFVSGWALEAICQHLEAVSYGKITRLLINVPPGACKSLTCNVFFPAWEWAAMKRPSLRYFALSYAADLTWRDNRKLCDLIMSDKFQELYGHQFELDKIGQELITNNKTGFKNTAGIRGTVTGNRADRVILDDPNSIKESDSPTVRNETARFFREGIQNRLNNLTTSAIIVIQQRVHEDDITGLILSDELPYVHLCLPLLYDPDNHCSTSIGWSDPRTIEGECLWPERFPLEAVEGAKAMGIYAFSGQYQQQPEPRGGGMFKREYWMPWSGPHYPVMDFTIASLDPAYTEKEQNDPSALTIWGCFSHERQRAIFLMYAWRRKLDLHGPLQPRWRGETNDDYRDRCKDSWGLVETVADNCRKFKVNTLLIENKASGKSVNQEMIRLFPDSAWQTVLVDPGNLDKMARAIRVHPIFTDDQVWAPGDIDGFEQFNFKRFASLVVDEMAVFPNGRYDDLTDSVTQALWYLRVNGFMTRESEAEEERMARMTNYQTPQPLYPS